MDNEQERVSEAIDKTIKRLTKRIQGHVDKTFVERELTPVLKRLEAKRDAGTLDLKDYADFLRVCRNTILPAAMLQQVERLQHLKELIKVAG